MRRRIQTDVLIAHPQGLQYADLANFENRLYTNNAIAQSERDSVMRDRLAFDALDDAARAATWNSYSPGYRSRLGLDTGYYGSQYGRSVSYDPAYSAFGYYSNPGGSARGLCSLSPPRTDTSRGLPRLVLRQRLLARLRQPKLLSALVFEHAARPDWQPA